MNTEQMKALAGQFLRDYIKYYKFDLSNRNDTNEFIKAISTLEVSECEYFFKKNNINILEYSQFRMTVLKEMPNIIQEEQKQTAELKKIVSFLVYQMNFEKLELREAKRLYNIIKQENITNFKIRIESSGIQTSLTEEEITKLKSNLLEVMEEMHPSILENTEIIKSADYEIVESFIEEALNEIPENGINRENYDEFLQRMLTRIEEYLNFNKVNKVLIERAKQIFTEKFNKKYKKEISLNYYQKIVEVFRTFDYDHLTEEERINLLNNVKNDNFLSKSTELELNINEEEHKKIQKDLIAKLEELLIRKDDTIYNRYIKLLQDADASYYEELQKHLNITEIRENNPEAKDLTDDEIKALIKDIKTSGINITLEKIMETDKVKEFVNKFREKASKLKVGEFDKLEKELTDFKNSKEMLDLTEFNKMLLVAELEKELKDYKWTAEFQQKTEKAEMEWDQKIRETKTEELMNLYNKFDNMTAEDFGIKELTDEELDLLRNELKGYVLDELAIRILEDLDMENAKDLDALKEIFANWKKEDFEKYSIPEELQEQIKNIVNEKIDTEKEKRQKASENKDQYLKIDSEVILTKDVAVYDDGSDFEKNKPLNDKKVKTNKKGKIDGYVVKKGDEIVELDYMVDLKKRLADGYEFVGYKFKYKNFLTETFTYVKPDEIKALEKESLLQKAKRNWKKVAATAALIIAATVAAFGFAKKSNNNSVPTPSEQETTAAPGNAQKDQQDISNSEDKKEEITADEKVIYVDENNKELDEEIVETLNSMPGLDVEVGIDHEARIWGNIDELGETNGQRSYFNARGEYDRGQKNDGFVLQDENGRRVVIDDLNTVYDLIGNQNYHYIGTRMLNKYSKHDQDYEGLFLEKDIVLYEQSKTLLDELEESGKVRRLTK